MEVNEQRYEEQKLKNFKDFLFQTVKKDEMFFDDWQKSIRINFDWKVNISSKCSACFGCSSYFEKGREIHNQNPFYHHVFPLSKSEVLVEGKLDDVVLGMANSGGGMIIVGASKSGNGIKIEGIPISEPVGKLVTLLYGIQSIG